MVKATWPRVVVTHRVQPEVTHLLTGATVGTIGIGLAAAEQVRHALAGVRLDNAVNEVRR